MPEPREGETRDDFISRCIPVVLDDGTAEDNEQAVAVCNSMWEQETGEAEMPITDIGQIARSAIEVGMAVLTGSDEISQSDALRLLEALENDLGEAVTKTVDGKPRPAGDFLVVEDAEKPSTWHLPVKVNGKPDRKLAAEAWAALFSEGGFRGQKYAGPDKAGA